MGGKQNRSPSRSHEPSSILGGASQAVWKEIRPNWGTREDHFGVSLVSQSLRVCTSAVTKDATGSQPEMGDGTGIRVVTLAQHILHPRPSRVQAPPHPVLTTTQ